MKEMAHSYFWWPGIEVEIKEEARGCPDCQNVRNMPQIAPLHPWDFPEEPWQRIHVDFAGQMEFVSDEFQSFLLLNGIQHIRSAPYHPSTNGLAERFIQTLKKALKTSQGKFPKPTIEHISVVLQEHATYSH